MARVIRARLDGANAEPGRVAAADAARMILGLERAIARAAYLVLGRFRRGSGRHVQAIESAARLRFVGVEAGSFVELLALPDTAEPSNEALPIAVADLSSQAFDRLIDTIASGSTEIDVELAAAVAQMSAELGIGDRNTSVTLIDAAERPGEAPRRATIDVAVRERMQGISQRPPTSKDETLVGVLVEADFEGHTARLRLPDGTPVTVKFSTELADAIHEALRSHARIKGTVRYHPRTCQAVTVTLSEIDTGTQLPIDSDAFWQSATFADLQESQGVTGKVDLASIGISDLTDDERVAFLAALAE